VNGRIDFAGYSWIVKDSGGGAVGPGPNVFVGSQDFIWVDNWGLHVNVRPRWGCDGWASSEVWNSQALGYGTYLYRSVGPVEFLDPQVTVGPFLWDDSGNAGNGWREIDFEYARWGNGGDPTSSQFVLTPLRPGNSPGWKVRWYTRNTRLISGNGQGGGDCNLPGAGEFNGAGISPITCALRWFQGYIQWYCTEGLWTLQTFGQAPKLLASYKYPAPQFVPDPGRNSWHFNVWQANAGRPGFGRRVHMIFNGFEFTQQNLEFPRFPENSGLARLLLERTEETRWLASTLTTGDLAELEQEFQSLNLTLKERAIIRAIIREHDARIRSSKHEGRPKHGHESAPWNRTAMEQWLASIPHSADEEPATLESNAASRLLQASTGASSEISAGKQSCGDPYIATMKSLGNIPYEASSVPADEATASPRKNVNVVAAVLGTLGGIVGAALLLAGVITIWKRQNVKAATGYGSRAYEPAATTEMEALKGEGSGHNEKATKSKVAPAK